MSAYLTPHSVQVLERALEVAAADLGAGEGAYGLDVRWYEDEDDGPCIDVAVRAKCGCTHGVARFQLRASCRPHAVITCERHRPPRVELGPEVEAVPF